MPPPKKRGGKSEGDAEAVARSEPTDETAEYELGDDFLSDLEEEELEDEELVDEQELEEDEALEDEADEDLEEAELDEEDPDAEYDEDELEDDYDEEGEPVEGESEETIGAETQEWDGSGDEEQTLVASAGARFQQARSKITSGFDAVGAEKITSGFRAVGRHIRFPLWARFLTASAVIVAVVGTATAASLLLYVGDIGDRIGIKNSALGRQIGINLEAVEGGAPQTIMILGSDKRPELTAQGNKERGLSDTTMLLRLDPDREAIALFSLPRDLKVEIPGYGVAKLNEAYFAGGPALTLRTIKNLTGLEVNHLVNVDFEGFARAVNAIDCVYVDVDRRYFNSNEGKAEPFTYEEIDLQPGYQALCGFDALDYARYRHTDNDVVRAARQQDFLREARQKVPPEVVFAERKELIDIFTKHTTSDIDSAGEMLQVLKLFIEARNAEVKQVHFEGTLGPSFVTTTPQEVEKAVNEFLGIEATPGPPSETAAPEDPSRAGAEPAPDASGSTPATPGPKKAKRKGKKGGSAEPAQLVDTSFGRKLARGIQRRRLSLPTYYPTKLELGTDYAQKPRVYKINGTGEGSPPNGERAAYKWVFSRPALGEYYGFMATRWQDPPILKNPSETRQIDGREFKLFYDGDRLRLVAWQTDEGSFWVSNTLIQSLSEREMLGIAKGMRELPPPGA